MRNITSNAVESYFIYAKEGANSFGNTYIHMSINYLYIRSYLIF